MRVKPAEEDPQIPFHGVAFVDMGRLLYPGVTHIRGAYSIQPFSETELLKKVKQKHILNVCIHSFFCSFIYVLDVGLYLSSILMSLRNNLYTN